VYCEHCGLRILPEHPVCTRCGKSPTYEWIQLTSLLVILLAVIGNEVTGWLLLPKMAATHPSGHFFRTWLWVDRETSVYGWMPLALGLLMWEFYVWRQVRKAKPVTKIRSWVSRKILTFVLAAGFRRFCRGGFRQASLRRRRCRPWRSIRGCRARFLGARF
jgi:hypothetical protein